MQLTLDSITFPTMQLVNAKTTRHSIIARLSQAVVSAERVHSIKSSLMAVLPLSTATRCFVKRSEFPNYLSDRGLIQYLSIGMYASKMLEWQRFVIFGLHTVGPILTDPVMCFLPGGLSDIEATWYLLMVGAGVDPFTYSWRKHISTRICRWV